MVTLDGVRMSALKASIHTQFWPTTQAAVGPALPRTETQAMVPAGVVAVNTGTQAQGARLINSPGPAGAMPPAPRTSAPTRAALAMNADQPSKGGDFLPNMSWEDMGPGRATFSGPPAGPLIPGHYAFYGVSETRSDWGA